MALRGKKPTTVETRLKALFHGDAGAGKTTAAIQFPNPYLIDTEKGASQSQYSKMLEKNGGAIFQTTDFDEIVDEVKCLITDQHDFKTLVIDPITPVYDNLLYNAEKKVGSEFGRHYSEANKKFKRLVDLLMRLDMNVIITAHSKNQYGDGMNVIGSIADGYKKLPYIFDLVLMIKRQGDERVAYVQKTRMNEFKDSFNFSYDSVARIYGHGILERECIPQDLSSEDQVKEIYNLIEFLKIEEPTYSKWLAKSASSNFNEMPKETIQKCIDHLKSKINKEVNIQSTTQ